MGSCCRVNLVHLSLLYFGFGLDLDFLVLLPALVSIIKHVPDQELESLTDGPAASVLFHRFKARENGSLFLFIIFISANLGHSLLEDLTDLENELERSFHHVIVGVPLNISGLNRQK